MRERIQTLDGLRFLAALGVLWIHTWTYYKNPRWFIGNVDITNILAIGGNGVDLFFVISGFCMYYFYAPKVQFSYGDFYRFIVKRWVRLSPAFYCATLFYILIRKLIYHGDFNPFLFFMNSLFYFNSIKPQYSIAGHLWTLGVEWQFYFIMPFILIYQNRIGFKKSFSLVFGLLFLLAIILSMTSNNSLDILVDQIIFRGMQFGSGIIAARVLLKKRIALQNRWAWLIIFVALTYAGRVLISKQALDIFPDYSNLFKLVGFSIMGVGFGAVLYLSLTSAKWLNLILGNRLFRMMGKISYSFYLWHPLLPPFAMFFLTRYFPEIKGISAAILATLVSAIILYPISRVSYSILEKPFLSIGNLTTK